MKILIQRVTHAKVEVEGTTVGTIGPGALVFIGITHDDTTKQASWLANKLINLRIFKDSHGKINQSILDHNGEILVISQFTLYAECSEGRRPSFTKAAQPELAKCLYEQFVEEVRKGGIVVETGVFGAEMKISLTNDGPVTLILEHLSSSR
ncbi:MAG: D-tyrosyl-tRNA(Tyr) deacylase [Parachlamydiaceae bacterium]|nr:D-tyrosyl-tRNA(Tyr) deacylase [Parachlamydiaceae bacterium]